MQLYSVSNPKVREQTSKPIQIVKEQTGRRGRFITDGYRGIHGSCACSRKVGGARRDRTDDLLLAKQALSQLSYGPVFFASDITVVGLGRVELPTSPLSGVRSNQLSYRPRFGALTLMDVRGSGASFIRDNR